MYEVDPNLSPEQLEEAGFVITDEQEELSHVIDAVDIEPSDEEIEALQDLSDELEQEDLLEEEIEELQEADPKALEPETIYKKSSKAYKDYCILTPQESGPALFAHKTAVIGDNLRTNDATPSIGMNAVIGNDCVIQAMFVGREVSIGDRSTFEKGSMLGAEGKAQNWEKPAVTIGSDVVGREGVGIRPNSEVGDRTEIGKGSVIGYQLPTKNNPGREKKGNSKTSPKTIVGKDCTIGDRVQIEAGAKIGSGYYIPPGTKIPKNFVLGNSEDTGITTIDNNEVARQLAKQVPKNK